MCFATVAWDTSRHSFNRVIVKPGTHRGFAVRPEWVGPAHLLNYLSHLRIDLRSTDSLTALPSPVKAKAFAMPCHDRFERQSDQSRDRATQSQRSVTFNLVRAGSSRCRTPR